VDLSGDDHGVRGSDETVFRDGLADLSDGDFGGERLSMEDHWFVIAVIDIHCEGTLER